MALPVSGERLLGIALLYLRCRSRSVGGSVEDAVEKELERAVGLGAVLGREGKNDDLPFLHVKLDDRRLFGQVLLTDQPTALQEVLLMVPGRNGHVGASLDGGSTETPGSYDPLEPSTTSIIRFQPEAWACDDCEVSEASGEYRLVIGRGEVLRGPKSFSGTSGLLKFDRPAREILEVILAEGLEHHISITYGDQTEALIAFAKLLKIPVLQLIN